MGVTKSPQIRINDAFIRRQDIVTSEMDRDLVMLSIDNGKYYGMNDVGRHVWYLLKEQTRVGDICRRLRTEFEVDPNQCEKEVIIFLQNLLEENLVSRRDDASM